MKSPGHPAVLAGPPARLLDGRRHRRRETVNNTADAATIDRVLPNVGPAKAQAIVDHRKSTALSAARATGDGQGIGLKTVEKNRDRIVVGGARALAAGRRQARAEAGRPPLTGRCSAARLRRWKPSPQSSFVVPRRRPALHALEERRRLDFRRSLRAPDVDDWDWRLSIAEIEADAPFSAFPGVDRELCCCRQTGCACASTMARSARCIHRTIATRSPGNGCCSVNWSMARPATSNLMWKRGWVDARLVRPLVGPMVVLVEPGQAWALHPSPDMRASPTDPALVR